MFSRAIVRKPCRNMVFGITSADQGKPDYEIALYQHSQYVKALERAGLTVTVLEEDESFPDSVFVEDTALLTPNAAIITNPGAFSRIGEIHEVSRVVRGFYRNIEFILSPGNVDAGDIMMVGNHFYIGLSGRTNQEGARQMIKHLNKYGYTASTIALKDVLHLKTGISYLENNYLLACGEFLSKKELDHFNIIEVPKEEAYAANSLWVNGNVLVPEGFTKTKALIERAGYKTIPVDVSEFRKLDGGLSCLSLRF